MRKPDYGHCGLICLGCWRINRIFYYNRILGLDPYISIPRNNPEHRFSCPGFDPANAILKETRVSAKPVNDNAHDLVLPVLRQTCQCSHTLCKHPPPVNIRHKDDRGVSVFGHSEIHDIVGSEVYFSTGARSFHDNQVVFPAQAVKRPAGCFKEEFFLFVIDPRLAVPIDLTAQNNLGTNIARRLQQYRVHVHMG